MRYLQFYIRVHALPIHGPAEQLRESRIHSQTYYPPLCLSIQPLHDLFPLDHLLSFRNLNYLPPNDEVPRPALGNAYKIIFGNPTPAPSLPLKRSVSGQ